MGNLYKEECRQSGPHGNLAPSHPRRSLTRLPGTPRTVVPACTPQRMQSSLFSSGNLLCEQPLCPSWEQCSPPTRTLLRRAQPRGPFAGGRGGSLTRALSTYCAGGAPQTGPVPATRQFPRRGRPRGRLGSELGPLFRQSNCHLVTWDQSDGTGQELDDVAHVWDIDRNQFNGLSVPQPPAPLTSH